MAFKFNPLTSQLDLVGGGSDNPYITNGTDGIAVIRMESDNHLWDMTIDDTGAWVSTIVLETGTPMGLLLALTYEI